jgi:hypothetical protein
MYVSAIEKRPVQSPKRKAKVVPRAAPVSSGQQIVRQVVRHVHGNNKVIQKTVDRITAEVSHLDLDLKGHVV